MTQIGFSQRDIPPSHATEEDLWDPDIIYAQKQVFLSMNQMAISLRLNGSRRYIEAFKNYPMMHLKNQIKCFEGWIIGNKPH